MSNITPQAQADILKGAANHYRIRTLQLLANARELTLESIVEQLGSNYKTTAVHVARMHRSGLISKRYTGAFVVHKLTLRGRRILTFLRILE